MCRVCVCVCACTYVYVCACHNTDTEEKTLRKGTKHIAYFVTAKYAQYETDIYLYVRMEPICYDLVWLYMPCLAFAFAVALSKLLFFPFFLRFLYGYL